MRPTRGSFDTDLFSNKTQKHDRRKESDRVVITMILRKHANKPIIKFATLATKLGNEEDIW